MPSGGIYSSTRIWWVKLFTRKLTLSVQLWLWYEQGMDSAMSTHVSDLECKSEEEFVSKWAVITLTMCSDQLLTSKIHGTFNWRNAIYRKHHRPPDFHLPTKNFVHGRILPKTWGRISQAIGYEGMIGISREIALKRRNSCTATRPD